MQPPGFTCWCSTRLNMLSRFKRSCLLLERAFSDVPFFILLLNDLNMFSLHQLVDPKIEKKNCQNFVQHSVSFLLRRFSPGGNFIKTFLAVNGVSATKIDLVCLSLGAFRS